MGESEGLWPKNRNGWLLFVTLFFVSWFMYYGLIFDSAYSYYLGQKLYVWGTFSYLEEQNLQITIHAPKHVINFVDQTLVVEIKNIGKDPIGCYDTTSDDHPIVITPLILTIAPMEAQKIDASELIISTTKSDMALANIEGGNRILANYLTFDCIPPQGTALGIFYVLVRKITTPIELEMYIGGHSNPIDLSYKLELENSGKAFWSTIFGYLLVPPWANIWLAIIVLISVKLLEDEEEGSAKHPTVQQGLLAVGLYLLTMSALPFMLGSEILVKLWIAVTLLVIGFLLIVCSFILKARKL